MKYDLEERTAKFAEEIIEFSHKIKKDVVTLPLISQLVRAGTSVGANYAEAQGASSKKDFRNKIHICKKEIQETCYWLRMMQKADKYLGAGIEELQKEAKELTLIFNKISYTLNNEKDSKGN